MSRGLSLVQQKEPPTAGRRDGRFPRAQKAQTRTTDQVKWGTHPEALSGIGTYQLNCQLSTAKNGQEPGTPLSSCLAALGLALFAYCAAIEANGNGFVAAFIAGM